MENYAPVGQVFPLKIFARAILATPRKCDSKFCRGEPIHITECVRSALLSIQQPNMIQRVGKHPQAR